MDRPDGILAEEIDAGSDGFWFVLSLTFLQLFQ
jgi:hypothetical protein